MDLNIPKIGHKDLEKILDVHMRTKIPLLLLGGSGIGKSTHVREYAEKRGIGYKDIRLVHYEPTDIKGLPFPEGDRVVWKKSDILPDPERDGEVGILFLDEINHAPPSVLHAAYELILDRKIGDYRLPDGWLIVAAGNTEEDDPYVNEIPAPLRNRMAIYYLEKPTAEEWAEYATKRGIDRRVVEFILASPQYLFVKPNEGEKTQFPTPRAWEFVGRSIAGIEDPVVLHNVVAGFVGVEAAQEFISYIETRSAIPKIDDVLERPDLIEGIPPYKCYRYALDAEAAVSRGNVEKAARIIDILIAKKPEVGIAAIRIIRSNHRDKLAELGAKLQPETMDRISELLKV